MNKYNAAIAAGYSENTACTHTSQLEREANIKDVLDRRGLTDKKIVDSLAELIEATTVESVYVTDPETGKKRHELVNVPDNAIRLRTIEAILKVKGHLRDKVDQEVVNVQQNNVIQFFQNIRKSEAKDINSGADALSVLLGSDMIDSIRQNGHPASPF